MSGRGKGGKVKKSPKSTSSKAGLQFPVTRIRRYLKKGNYGPRGMAGSIYLAAVLEYLTAEILELAGNAARDNKKARIIPRHLLLAVKNDDELNGLLKHVTISQGGVLPNIQSVLLPKKSSSIEKENAQINSVAHPATENSVSMNNDLNEETDLLPHFLSSIAPPVLHYRSMMADKGPLRPTDGHVVNEFSDYGSYQEQEVRTKRGRKKNTGSAGSETSVVSDVSKMFSSLRYLSAFLTNQTLIKPEILNVIWKSFFLDSNEVSLHLKAQDILQEYFMLFPWSIGSNRLVLVDSVLSSLRDVSDQSMFSKFERENSRDLSDVVSFVEDIIEKCSTENVNQGAISVLNILGLVFKRDFIQWWREEKWKGNFPLIYYVMGGSSSMRTMIKMVAKLYKNQTEMLRNLAREVVSLTAMLAAFLDQKEKEGLKMELAQVIAKILDEEDSVTIFVECSLLQPSWLSLLVKDKMSKNKY